MTIIEGLNKLKASGLYFPYTSVTTIGTRTNGNGTKDEN